MDYPPIIDNPPAIVQFMSAEESKSLEKRRYANPPRKRFCMRRGPPPGELWCWPPRGELP